MTQPLSLSQRSNDGIAQHVGFSAQRHTPYFTHNAVASLLSLSRVTQRIWCFSQRTPLLAHYLKPFVGLSAGPNVLCRLGLSQSHRGRQLIQHFPSITNMAFVKKLNKFSLGSQDSEGFFLQQLLHHKPLSKEGPNGILPSFSSIEAAEYRPFRRSTLIKELYDTAISALESIGPFKGKKSTYVGYEMERSASCLQTKISVREVDLGAIEDMLRSTNLDTLYAEVFRNLSEMVFLACMLSPSGNID